MEEESEQSKKEKKSNKWDWNKDVWKIWDIYFLQKNAFAKNQLDSFNHFVRYTMPSVISHYSPIVIKRNLITSDSDERYEVHFTKVYVGKPMVQEIDDSVKLLYPQDARNRNLTYSAPVFVDIKHVVTGATKNPITKEEKKIPLCRLPIMIHSDYCNLHGLPNSVIKELGECEYDQGGYFIVGGGEKVLIPQERIAENMPHIRRRIEKRPTGDVYEYSIDVRSSLNQSYYPVKSINLKTKEAKESAIGISKIPFMSNKRKIYVSLQFIKGDIPIFVIFRALGVLTDYDIIKYILPDIDTLIDKEHHDIANKMHLEMLKMLEGSAQNIFFNEYDEETKTQITTIVNSKYRALKYIGFQLEGKDIYTKDKENKKDKEDKLVEIATNVIEHEFLPHLGKSNIKKLHYLAYMIRLLLGAVMGVVPVDDRDSVANKRVENTGALLTQLFGRSFQKLEKSIKNAISEDYIQKQSAMTENDIKYLRGIIQSSSIESKLKYALSTGNWQMSKNSKTTLGKMGVSQALQRHSYAGYLSHLRRVQTPLESTSSKLVSPRKFHGTQLGYFCIDETPEGQNVGTVKNFAYFAHVTNGSDPINIHIILNTLIVKKIHKEYILHNYTERKGAGKQRYKWRYFVYDKIYTKYKDEIDNIMTEKGLTMRYFNEKWYIGKFVSDQFIGNYYIDIDIEEKHTSIHLVKPIELCIGNDFDNKTTIFVNGCIYGLIDNEYSIEVYEYLKLLKRSGSIDIYTSVSFDYDKSEIHVHTEAGRLVRPCLVVYPINETILEVESKRTVDVIQDLRKKIEFTRDRANKFGQSGNVVEQNKLLKRVLDMEKSLSSIQDQQSEFLEGEIRNISIEHLYGKSLITFGGNVKTILHRDMLMVETYKRLKGDIDVANLSWNDLLTSCISVRTKNITSKYLNVGTDEIDDSSMKSSRFNVGVIEYLDIYEEKNAVIAFDYSEIAENRKRYIESLYLEEDTEFMRYTHCDIHSIVMKGVISNAILFANKNPSPRNIFECAMTKQAICKPTTNMRQRMDTMANELIYPMRPIVSTRGNKYTYVNEIPFASQVIVAIACYTGYNQDDSVMINKSSVDRGLFQSIFYRTYTDSQKGKTATSSSEKFVRPDDKTTIGVRGKNYGAVDDDGYPIIGKRVEEGDVVIGKVIEMRNEIDGKKYKDMSTTVRHGEHGQIDRVLPSKVSDRHIFTDNDGNKIVKVRVARLRKMIIGDKVAVGPQKGTCGMLYDQEDMPFTRDGICPDIIMNPHAIPSRMTMAQLFECVVGKAGVLSGRFFDATAFTDIDMREISSILRRNGFDEYGDEYLYSGITGRRMKTKIFIGTSYYKRLKHMVDDKIHARNDGPVQLMTRQPAEGRSRNGGLRLGEMERDCMIGYGASQFLKERFMNCSDLYRVYTAKDIGMNIVVNKEQGIYRNGDEDIDQKDVDEIQIPYAMKLLSHEINALGVKIIPKVKE